LRSHTSGSLKFPLAQRDFPQEPPPWPSKTYSGTRFLIVLLIARGLEFASCRLFWFLQWIDHHCSDRLAIEGLDASSSASVPIQEASSRLPPARGLAQLDCHLASSYLRGAACLHPRHPTSAILVPKRRPRKALLWSLLSTWTQLQWLVPTLHDHDSLQ
jgi:hypothetical protein